MLFALKELFVRLEGKREKGQTLIEYALLVVLIAIVVIVALQLLGPQISNVFDSIRGDLGDLT